MHTSCTKCYFANPISSGNPCQLNIIDNIRDSKELSIIDDFYQIHNYYCRYGISREIYEDKIKNMDVDLTSYAINRLLPKYFLYIISDNKDNSVFDICNYIAGLSIRPTAVSIVIKKQYADNALSHCQDILHDSVNWKLHVLVDEDTDDEKIAKNLLSTDKRCANCQYVFFVKQSMLAQIIKNNSIDRINTIINILQPEDISVLCSRSDLSYFNGIFIRMDNFKNSTSLLQTNISNIISDNYKDLVDFYD